MFAPPSAIAPPSGPPAAIAAPMPTCAPPTSASAVVFVVAVWFAVTARLPGIALCCAPGRIRAIVSL